MSPAPFDLRQYRHIVVLTGAGVSVASGLPTYRGAGGLWEEGDTARVSTVDILETDPRAAWQFFGSLRPKIAAAQPNKAHSALAECQRHLKPNQSFTLVTQNIDGLHQRAGSTDVVELHGSLFSTRCSNEKCSLEPYADQEGHLDILPKCSICQSLLRPDIVFFGEAIPAKAEWLVKRALRNCDLFIAVGTSGTVSPACDFVRSAKYAGARTILVNLEPMVPGNSAFDQELLGPAEELLPSLIAVSS
jgi:NAD-dependent deacetylase